LHMSEVAGHCRQISLVGIFLGQFRKLEVCLDPEFAVRRSIFRTFVRRNVEVGPHLGG
jgi:hypothetical protein